MQASNTLECESPSPTFAVDAAARLSTEPGAAFGKWVFHPFLLASYPILALFAQNVREVRSVDLVRLLVSVLLATLAVWFVLALATSNVRKGGLLASAALFLFFTTDLTTGILSEPLSWLSRIWVPKPIEVDPKVVIIIEVLLL